MSTTTTAVRVDRIVVRWSHDDESDGPSEHCQAVARVSYLITDTSIPHRRLEWLTSGGLGGIQGATDEYRADIAAEEISDLRDHLAMFGIVLSDVEWGKVPRDVEYK